MSPIAPIIIDLQVGGTPVAPVALRMVQSLCDMIDTLEIQSSDLSLKDTLPFTEVTCTIGSENYFGYVKKTVINLPTGLVTITVVDAGVKAQDYYELGDLIAGVYTPIQAAPLSDVSYWFGFWATRMNIPYEAAANTGRVVPEDKTWQFTYGTDIFRELTSYAGSGTQVKADAEGVLHLIKYSGVTNSGDLPASIHTERTVSDEWVRNEAVVYWAAGVVDLTNPASDVPPTLFRRRALMSSIYIQDEATATDLAVSLLEFYAEYMNVWSITAVDLDVVFEPGIVLGDKLLISNITTFTQGGAGLMQELVFDRFCPNMWGNGIGQDFLANAYTSTLVYHALLATGSGLSPVIISPTRESYEVFGAYVFGTEAGVVVTGAIYEDGIEMVGTSFTAVTGSAQAAYRPYVGVTLLVGHAYQLYVNAENMGSVRVGWKYKRLTDDA